MGRYPLVQFFNKMSDFVKQKAETVYSFILNKEYNEITINNSKMITQFD